MRFYMTTIRIYSKPLCQDCNRAKAFLKEKGVQFEDIDIVKNKPAHEEMVHQYGIDVLPVIVIDDQVMVGFNPPKINRLLSSH
jgi:glutaredoxin-like YruB-family protein